MTQRTATCSCGALRVVCTGDPVRNSICHCIACKRRTGSPFSHNATFEGDQVTASGAASTFTRQSDGGRWCRYHFCPTCGATVFYEIEARPGRISVPVGAFGDPAFPEPTIAVHGGRCEHWVAFTPSSPLMQE